MEEKCRCSWAGDVPVYVDYHDNEWGRPTHDDRMLFELLVLEGAQAGLSWLTILKKREAYREAFDGFDPAKVALYDEAKVEELMANEGIVRNRLKINAAITNAKLFLDVAREFGSFDAFIWGYVDGEPIVNRWKPRPTCRRPRRFPTASARISRSAASSSSAPPSCMPTCNPSAS